MHISLSLDGKVELCYNPAVPFLRGQLSVIEIHNRFRPDCSNIWEKVFFQFHFKEIRFEGNRNGCGVGFYIREE